MKNVSRHILQINSLFFLLEACGQKAKRRAHEKALCAPVSKRQLKRTVFFWCWQGKSQNRAGLESGLRPGTAGMFAFILPDILTGSNRHARLLGMQGPIHSALFYPVVFAVYLVCVRQRQGTSRKLNWNYSGSLQCSRIRVSRRNLGFRGTWQ